MSSQRLPDMKQILQELLEQDPSWQQDEEKLAKTLDFLVQMKPQSHLDETFKKQLRTQLDTKIAQISRQKAKTNKVSSPSYFRQMRFLFPFVWGMAFAAAFGAFLWPQMLINQKQPLPIDSPVLTDGETWSSVQKDMQFAPAAPTTDTSNQTNAETGVTSPGTSAKKPVATLSTNTGSSTLLSVPKTTPKVQSTNPAATQEKNPPRADEKVFTQTSTGVPQSQVAPKSSPMARESAERSTDSATSEENINEGSTDSVSRGASVSDSLMMDDAAPMADRDGGSTSDTSYGRGGAMSLMGTSGVVQKNYEWVYTGASFPTADQLDLPVYKRTQGLSLKNTKSALNFSIESLNTESLSNAQLDSLSFKENIQHGYILNFQMSAGEISVSPNSDYWPEIYCNKYPCAANQSYANASALPSNEQIIQAASALSNKLALDKNLYGAPVVVSPSAHDRKNQTAFGSEADVLLPLQFNKKPVYDTYGNQMGAHIGVNLHLLKATSVYNLIAGTFSPTKTTLNTNKESLLAQAKSGGVWGSENGNGSQNKEVTKLSLGDPKIAYVAMYKNNEWMYVPCLVFAVTSPIPADVYLPNSIIVPLLQAK